MNSEKLLYDSIKENFNVVSDPRADDNRKRHKLLDIIVISLSAVICGADDWIHIAEFGKSKREWFKTFLSLPNGIPSHDTFRRVFMLLDPEEFVRAFSEWTAALSKSCDGDVVSIDGKSLRRAYDSEDILPVHIVNAWSKKNQLTLAQERVAGKSNEITAIPKILDLLNLSGAVVTIDAIGCQKKIASKIISKEADYVLALKGNQETLFNDVKEHFTTSEKHSEHHTTDGSEHGRIEERSYYLYEITKDPIWKDTDKDWQAIKSIGMVKRSRELTNGTTSQETCFYITSLKQSNIMQFADAVRSHWGVENSLHWVLDVAFREDDNRCRSKNLAENMAVLRKMAHNLLKKDSSVKIGIKGKRLKAGWDFRYLLQILQNIKS